MKFIVPALVALVSSSAFASSPDLILNCQNDLVTAKVFMSADQIEARLVVESPGNEIGASSVEENARPIVSMDGTQTFASRNLVLTVHETGPSLEAVLAPASQPGLEQVLTCVTNYNVMPIEEAPLAY